MTLNGRAIKTWSTMQPTIALSSGEAELTAFVKAASEGIGVQSLARDMGLELTVSGGGGRQLGSGGDGQPVRSRTSSALGREGPLGARAFETWLFHNRQNTW